jgi:hypothetical protein
VLSSLGSPSYLCSTNFGKKRAKPYKTKSSSLKVLEELDCHLKFEPMLGDSQLFFFFFSFVKPQQVSGWFSK